MIELAVSELCIEGSDPQCVPIDGEFVTSPATFETAGVREAAVTGGDERSTVGLVLTDEGAAVLVSLSEEAVRAGDGARLVMRIGDEVRSAVSVAEPVTGGALTIPAPSDDDAQELVDLLLGD